MKKKILKMVDAYKYRLLGLMKVTEQGKDMSTGGVEKRNMVGITVLG